MSNQVGIKEVMNLTMYDFVSATPLAYVDYAETTEIDNAGTRLDISGGQGNFRLLSFDHSKISTMKVKFPIVDTTFLSLLMGDTVTIGAQNILTREVLTVTAGAATLSQTPIGVPTIYYLSGQRDNGTIFSKVASAPTAGQFAITGSALTLATADNSLKIVVYYTYATPSTTTKYSMKANKFIAPMKIVGTGIVRDQVTDTDRASIITIYNAKFKPNFNLSMSSTAATSLDLDLDMYGVLINGDYVYYDVVYLT